MGLNLKVVFVFFTLCLVACADNGSDVYGPPTALSAGTGVTVLGSRLDTGVPVLGETRVRIGSVDGRRTMVDYDRPLLLAPGTHTILIIAVRDKIASHASVSFTFEPGKDYIVRSSPPSLEATVVWLEDKATGQPAGQKFAAVTNRVGEPPIFQLFHPK